MTTLEFKSVGSFYNDFDVCEPEVLEPVEIVPEPENKYDSNALSIWIRGFRVGYVPKTHAQMLALLYKDLNFYVRRLNTDGTLGLTVVGVKV